MLKATVTPSAAFVPKAVTGAEMEINTPYVVKGANRNGTGRLYMKLPVDNGSHVYARCEHDGANFLIIDGNIFGYFVKAEQVVSVSIGL